MGSVSGEPRTEATLPASPPLMLIWPREVPKMGLSR